MFEKIKSFIDLIKARHIRNKRRKELFKEREEELEKHALQYGRRRKIEKKDPFYLGMLFKFDKKDKHNKQQKKNNLSMSIAGGIILFGILFLFFSSYFRINDIQVEIENHSLLDAADIYTFMEQFKEKSIFFLQNSVIAHELTSKFTEISDVNCDKVFPKLLKCIISEYKAALIIQKGEKEAKEYIINQAGKIISVRDKIGDDRYITVITTNQDMPTEIGAQVMDLETIDFIYNAKNRFEDRLGVRIISIWSLEKEHEVHLYTQYRFPIYLTLFRDVKEQLAELTAVFAYYDFSAQNIEYIDLRVKNKVFVK